MADLETEKRAAALAAAAQVRDGMRVGLGTGSTVAHLLPALAERNLRDLRCVATSPATAARAQEAGLRVEDFSTLDYVDIAIDGADQATPAGWLVKGGGGAHLREKIVAAAAHRFVVMGDSTKAVDRLRPPIPLELHAFGLAATLLRLRALGDISLRDAPPSPDDGVIADLDVQIDDPATLAALLGTDPGVAEHGLFPPFLVTEILIADGAEVRPIRPSV